MEPTKRNAERMNEIPVAEIQQGLLGKQINKASGVPESDAPYNAYIDNNNPAINQGYEIESKPGNMGGGLLNKNSDHERVQEILAKAKEDYKFLPKDMIAVANRRHDRYHLEAFPEDETGTMDRPRPEGIPLGKKGVEVYNVDGVTPEMIAADALHHDGVANDVRDILTNNLSDKQKDYLRSVSGDYQASLNQEKLGEAASMRNAVDSAVRGYVVGQWPKEVNDGMNYTPQQKELLDNLRHYMKTGQEK